MAKLNFAKFNFAAGLLALGVLAAPALAGAALELPPKPSGPVADLANVIDDADEATLDQELRDYYAQTGNSVVVATVPTLQGETVESYAEKLFRAWGIGDAKMDTGALLLVAPTEREVRIEVGYGLEGDLTDAESSWIVSGTIVPAFKAGDISGGTVAGAREIVKAIGDISYAPASAPVDSVDPSLLNILLLVAFVLARFLLGFLARTKAWWHGGLFGAGFGAFVPWWLGIAGGATLGLSVAAFAALGLALDFFVSRGDHGLFSRGRFWGGSGRGGGFSSGGGFGGFGGGSSGGGGASGRW